VRRFMTHLITEIDFVDDDSVSEEIAQNYEKHLMTVVREAAQALSLRTIRGTRVAKLEVAEIKSLISQ
jgi:hypothetical protein